MKIKTIKPITQLFFAVVIALMNCGCQCADRGKNKVYQVALLQSLTLGEYDGSITVGELKKHGDIGIGTFDGVNGELIMTDGQVYQALGNGKVITAADNETVPFATVGYFNPDTEISDFRARNLDTIKNELNNIVKRSGKNQFFFVKITGEFANMMVRSELKQKKPYKPLDVALKTDQREFEYKRIKGTIIGIYCPDYMGTLNAAGWHFHFISEDFQKGGHVIGMKGFSGKIALDKISRFEMFCPDTDTFNRKDLSTNQTERIKKVEQGTK